jgi:hypothetical protein
VADTSFLAIDHCVANTNNLVASTDALERLGFFLSPKSDLDVVGVANRLVLFESELPGCASFFEIMSPIRPLASLHASMRQVLQGPARLSWVVLASSNAEKSHEHLLKQGMGMSAPVFVRRQWNISEVESVWPEFNVTFPDTPDGQNLAFNLCQYHNVSLYHRSDWMKHPNGARRLTCVIAVVVDPEQTSRRYAELWSAQVKDLGAGMWRVVLGQTSLELMSPQSWSTTYPSYPLRLGFAGLRLLTNDLEGTRQYLMSNGVSAVERIGAKKGLTVQVTLDDHPSLIMEFCS